jgi:Formate--tetrahydrofolate ligase
MAVLAMSTSLQDMRDRLGAMVIGTSKVSPLRHRYPCLRSDRCIAQRQGNRQRARCLCCLRRASRSRQMTSVPVAH